MFNSCKTKIVFLFLILFYACQPVCARGFFETIAIETPSQAKSTLLALGFTAACAMYCGRIAYDLVDAQNKKAENDQEHKNLQAIGNIFVRIGNRVFGTNRQNPGNAGNPPQSFNYAPYIWSTISGLALIRSGILARSLYDYYSKAA